MPKEIKHSLPIKGDHQYWKVRKGWFTTIIIELGLLLRELFDEKVVLPDELFWEIVIFRKRYIDYEFTARLTTQEDIDNADEMIDKILHFLEDE